MKPVARAGHRFANPEAPLTFHLENTLVGYARAAVNIKTRMADAWTSTATRNYLTELLSHAEPLSAAVSGHNLTSAASTLASAVRPSWTLGEAFVLAPAMTAIIAAAAAAALDLTGDLLSADAAPCDTGVLFLPEPIYHRYPDGHLSAVGAITWIPITTSTHGRSWVICAWAPPRQPGRPPFGAAVRGTRCAAPPAQRTRPLRADRLRTAPGRRARPGDAARL